MNDQVVESCRADAYTAGVNRTGDGVELLEIGGARLNYPVPAGTWSAAGGRPGKTANLYDLALNRPSPLRGTKSTLCIGP